MLDQGKAYICTTPDGGECVVWASDDSDALASAMENGEGFDDFDPEEVTVGRLPEMDGQHQDSYQNPGEPVSKCLHGPAVIPSWAMGR
jgi:hypothetical protein